MTRRKLLKLLGRGVCTSASAEVLISASGFRASLFDAPQQAAAEAGGASVISPQDLATTSARAVLTRLLGARADDFQLDWIPPVDGRMLYQAAASGGRVSIRGSSGVAISRGAYVYLREACNAMVTWSGRHLSLPETLPDYREPCPHGEPGGKQVQKLVRRSSRERKGEMKAFPTRCPRIG